MGKIPEDLIVSRQPARLKQEIARLSGHPIEYTTTLYDKQGKLLDDGIDVQTERSYWEAFVEPEVAREVEQRLAMLEDPDYVPDFKEMDDDSESDL